ncbi:MAG TPA: ATPase, T2SS/T4P/T4SS family [Solirubrobacteraceae bacterium]|jgi:type IV pilus assembly protein PilB|nr:ATPase, T2SS/T4P/T4SS family [Solirubrobacteraceae bacterium]
MSTPPNGLRDENDIFGEAEPRVSVEIDRDEPSHDMPGDADGRPLTGGVDTTGVGDPYVSSYGSDVEQPDREGSEEIAGVTSPSRRGSSARFLTDVICDMGLTPRERVDSAIESSRNEGITPERVLLASGAITSDGLARALAERYGLDHLDLDVFPVDMGAANLVVNSAAKRYQAVPVAFVDKRTLLLAMADPSNVLAVDDVAIMTGYEVRVAVASPDAIGDLISRMARLEDVVSGDAAAAEEAEESSADIVNLRETADDAPVVKLVNQIVAQAVELGASDVHMAPDGHEVRVRVRVDGILQDITTVPRRMAAGVVSRVKIMAELDISERRLPQDGRVSLTVDGRHIDLRVVTLPSVHGESIVMRILDKDSVVMKLEKLGMADAERDRFERAFHETHGAVLVTGPTGSGKSTTLYAALLALNTPEKNIITVEDPVEYQIAGLTQVQVSSKAGLTFATGLRAMVRADPDIIMVGEIRDRETAQIAVESALTGHLVLSTLHTNDAPSAISRLTEMGIEPFLVASALDCVLAQRLARMLCSNCKQRTIVPAEVLRDNGYKALVDLEAYEPNGCRRCAGTGYRGRLGIYEVMTLSSEIRNLTLERRSADEIREVAVREGMRRLRDDGLEKVRQGLTSIAEIARVIGSS